MYQVLARKWRPKTFEELVGQDHVARTLGNAIAQDRLAHAYIFSGLRGTGKTSAARILAKCLNCEQGPTQTPCNECIACKEISEARAMDVLEMDAASRTGVDDIRELQEVVQYPPVRDRYKLMIIDEAHMLSKAAFNALLKTLEEPPPQVVFILATTELQKIIPTILSRCQVFEFRRVVTADVADHLERLANSESLDISRASLERIARAGEGSVRDSLSLLERVLAFCGQEANDEDVLRVLGSVRFELLETSIRGMAGRDAKQLIETLDQLCAEGMDLVFFWNELIGAIRDLLLHQASPKTAASTGTRSPQEFEQLADAAGNLTRADLLQIMQILAELEPSLKASSRPRFLFESALIRIAALAELQPIESLLQQIQQTGGLQTRLGTSTSTARKSGAPPRSASTRPPSPTQKKSLKAEVSVGPIRSDQFQATFLDAIEKVRPMIAAWLGQAASIRPEHGVLYIELPETQKLARDQLLRNSTVKVLAEQAQGILGGSSTWKIDIRCRGESESSSTPTSLAASDRQPSAASLTEANQATSEAMETSSDAFTTGQPSEEISPTPTHVDAPSTDEPPHSAESKTSQAPRSRNRRTALSNKSFRHQIKNDPEVAKLIKTFGAQVLDVKPLEEPVLETEIPEENS